MKIYSLVFGLALSGAALADGINFDREGKSATITGSTKSTSSEVLEFVSAAYDYGFKDADGADFFTKVTKKEGMRTHVAFKNKAVTVSRDSAFALIYKVELKGKAGEITVASDRSSVTVKGEAARMLMGALKTKEQINPRGPVGVGRVSTKSGKVVCSKVVAPRAVPSCTLKL